MEFTLYVADRIHEDGSYRFKLLQISCFIEGYCKC